MAAQLKFTRRSCTPAECCSRRFFSRYEPASPSRSSEVMPTKPRGAAEAEDTGTVRATAMAKATRLRRINRMKREGRSGSGRVQLSRPSLVCQETQRLRHSLVKVVFGGLGASEPMLV